MKEKLTICLFTILAFLTAIFTFYLVNFSILNDFYTSADTWKISMLIVFLGSLTYFTFLLIDRDKANSL